MILVVAQALGAQDRTHLDLDPKLITPKSQKEPRSLTSVSEKIKRHYGKDG
jgi:hypothetical protein